MNSRPWARALIVAGVALAAAGCGIAPVGPGAGPPPPARRLMSPITVQVMRSGSPATGGVCPAGWFAVVQPPAPPGAGSPGNPIAVSPCYRPAGSPVRITSAGIGPVVTFKPPPGHPGAPTTYGFAVAVPGTAAPAVTAIIKKAYDSGDAVGVSVGGKLWEAPQVVKPFPGQQLGMTTMTRKLALQVHQLLVGPVSSPA